MTSLACEMSTTNQTNSVSENSFPVVELKCDYYKPSYTIIFQMKSKNLRIKQFMPFNVFCSNNLKMFFILQSVGGNLEMQLIFKSFC